MGVRWLLRRLDIYPNAYYNYLRHRKSSYLAKKHKTLETISEIYHKNNGVVGYRNMKVYLERKGIVLSRITVHKMKVLCQVLGWVDFSAHFLYLKFFVLTILSGRIYLKADKYFFAQQKDLVPGHFLSCCH